MKDIKVSLDAFSLKKYKSYGISVLEDRAVPALTDGLKPVQRRVVWAAHTLSVNSKAKHVKSARIVGECLGKFHAHGDSSVYQAMVGLTNVGDVINNTSKGLFEGEGNWGSFSDRSAAAMRYTEARLSAFTDEILLNKFYLPVVEFGPNYDSSTVEPLELPSLLPLVFINGSSGIAVGATASIPRFTYKSVLQTLDLIYKGEEITPQLLYKNLEFTSRYGGHEVKSKATIADRKAPFISTRGSVTLASNFACADTKSGGWVATTFGSSSASAEKFLTKILAIKGVQKAYDDSSKTDKYGTLRVFFGKDSESAVKKVFTILSCKDNFFLNFTNRFLQKDGQLGASVTALSVTAAFKEWVEWRINLEVKACTHWIQTTESQIRKLDLLLLAVDNRKLIIESLDKDCSQAELDMWLSKRLKITPEEAAVIYDLKVKQLRKLERKTLEAERLVVLKKKKELEARRKNPKPYMAEQLRNFSKL